VASSQVKEVETETAMERWKQKNGQIEKWEQDRLRDTDRDKAKRSRGR
jgi:hypothetical protein